MYYDLFTLILFAMTLLNVVVNLVCGVLLLAKRREVHDRSRVIFAMPALLAILIFSNKMLFLAMHPQQNMTHEVLSPFIVFTSPVAQLMLLAYCVEVMRPNWMTWRFVGLMLTPWLLICLPALLSEVSFTPLYSNSRPAGSSA